MNSSTSCFAVLFRGFLFLVLLIGGSAFVRAEGPADGLSSREPLNHGWRFAFGDPANLKTPLHYDVRPEVRERRDDMPADAQPRVAENVDRSAQLVLKPWILPTANAFIRDPAKRHTRPAGEWTEAIDFTRADFDDAAWRQLDLPHDWAIEGPFIPKGEVGGMGRLPSWGVAWYRRKIEIPATDSGRSLFLEVDGAMSHAMVWLNGRIVGGWPYGYASWRVDLTPYVNFGGVNQLAIRLDNPPSSSRWYPGGGIYRNVWLTRSAPVRVAQWGTRVTTQDEANGATRVTLEVTVENATTQKTTAGIRTSIYELDATGARVGEPVAMIAPIEADVAGGGTTLTVGAVVIAKPKRWGPPPTQQPNRYVAVTALSHPTRATEVYETRFGIRTLHFDATAGLQVNGERIQLQGVNQHHDLGSLGAAFNLRAAERQLELLRELGCNAIRLSHNPPAPELLELTDRMGFLVIDEIFDVWERKKTPLDFHLIYADWSEADTRAWVRRDRNHPSVVMWSVGNEVGEQYTAEAGAAVATRLCEFVREEDPTRPNTSAMNFAKPDMALPAAVDVIGLNYQGQGIRDTPEFEGTNRIRTPPMFPAFHEKFPKKMIIASETASAFSSRGVYLFPVTSETSAPTRDGRGGDSKNRQVSSYELHAVDFGASADKVFASLERYPYVAGEFVWTGWDHLGEPTPYYDSRSSYCGIIDLAGFKKDRFFLYQSQWRRDLPMAHLLPHWTWPERIGEITPVHVFTSGDEAELFLNDRSLGRKKKGVLEYRLRWDDVRYEPGKLRVVAYRNGKYWAEDAVETTGDAAALALSIDRPSIRADGRDLAFITVRIVDEQGRLVPRSNHPLSFQLEGPGEIVATDNGDPTSFESFQAPQRLAFNGLCLVIVRAKPGQAGELRLTVTGAGLRAATTTVSAAH